MPRSRTSSRQEGPGNGIDRPPGRHPATAIRSRSGKPDAAPMPGLQPACGSRRFEAARCRCPGRQDETGTEPPAHPIRCIGAGKSPATGLPGPVDSANSLARRPGAGWAVIHGAPGCPRCAARNCQGPAGSLNAPGSSPDGHWTGGCRPCVDRPANALSGVVAGDDSHGDASSSDDACSSDDGLSSGDDPIRNGGAHNDIARMGGRGPAGNR